MGTERPTTTTSTMRNLSILIGVACLFAIAASQDDHPASAESFIDYVQPMEDELEGGTEMALVDTGSITNVYRKCKAHPAKKCGLRLCKFCSTHGSRMCRSWMKKYGRKCHAWRRL